MTGDEVKRIGSSPDITDQSKSQIDDFPYVVFLDTEVYHARSFTWTSSLLLSLIERVACDSIKLVSTDIVKGEIRRGIAKKYGDFRIELKKATKASLVLHCLEDERVVALSDLLENGPTLHEIEQGAWDFFTQTQTEIIPLTKDATLELFDLYFAGAPPFGDGKKKAEFPDAANMLALLKHSTEIGKPIYVVSQDTDWERACEAHSSLILVKELSEIIDKAIREEWTTDDVWAEADLMDLLRANKSRLISAIAMGLRSSTLVNAGDGDLYDLDVDDVELTGLALTDVAIEGGSLRLEGELFHNVTYSAQVSIYDEFWDNDLEEDLCGTEMLTGQFCMKVSRRKPLELRDIYIDYFDGLCLEVAIGF